jgi:anti-sigma-K factor RskA
MSEAREQISSYLLGELDAAAAAEFERGMAADPELREEVEGLRPVVARLEAMPADAWEPAEPPPLRMPAESGEPGAAVDAAEPRRPWLPTLTLRPAAAAGLATLLLAIGLGAGLLVGVNEGGGSPDGSIDLVLNRIDDGPTGAHGDVLLAGNEQRATLEIDGLDPSDGDQFYELWLLDDDGQMIALGSFRVGEDGEAEVDLPLPVEPDRYQYFDVSLQQDNGDPTHSGVSVLRGPTSS